MLESLQSASHRLVDLDYINLIAMMLHESRNRLPSETAAVTTHFSGGLSHFLYKFLRVQDCFLDRLNGPCIEIDFGFRYEQSILTATGRVNWQLPDVRFLPLPDRLTSGEEYRITPFVLGGTLDSSCGQRAGVSDQVTYSIPRSSLNFCWNPTKHYFRAFVPDYADVSVEVSCRFTRNLANEARREKFTLLRLCSRRR